MAAWVDHCHRSQLSSRPAFSRCSLRDPFSHRDIEVIRQICSHSRLAAGDTGAFAWHRSPAKAAGLAATVDSPLLLWRQATGSNRFASIHATRRGRSRTGPTVSTIPIRRVHDALVRELALSDQRDRRGHACTSSSIRTTRRRRGTSCGTCKRERHHTSSAASSESAMPPVHTL